MDKAMSPSHSDFRGSNKDKFLASRADSFVLSRNNDRP